METDTLTGPNLSYHVAVLEKKQNVRIHSGIVYFDTKGWNDENWFDCSDPATFQPIAEREKISVEYLHTFEKWQASTTCKKLQDGERYVKNVYALGGTEAEARMRCYVKSYLGDDTKE